MEWKFKIGDRVRCVDASYRHELTVGCIYRVRGYASYIGIEDGLYLDGQSCSFRQDRFELAGPCDFAVEDEGGVV